MNSTKDYIFEININNGSVIFQSEQFSDAFGANNLQLDNLVQQYADKFVHASYTQLFFNAFNLANIRRRFADSSLNISEEFLARSHSGADHYQWHKLTVFSPVDDMCHVILSNINEGITTSERLKFEAAHDVTSGLLNKRGFLMQVNELFANNASIVGGMFFVDIDNFKLFNDFGGHDHGDDIINKVSQFLREFLPHGSLVCRYGGDEFVFFVQGSRQTIVSIASRMNNHIRRDIAGDNITMSIGVALCSDNSVNPSALMNQADRALYQSKAIGKNTFTIANTDASDKLASNIDNDKALVKSRLSNAMKMLCLMLVLCIAVGIFATIFITTLRSSLQEETLKSLQTNAQVVNTNASKSMSTYNGMLNVLSDLVESSISLDEAVEHTSLAVNIFGFDNGGLISVDNGVVYYHYLKGGVVGSTSQINQSTLDLVSKIAVDNNAIFTPIMRLSDADGATIEANIAIYPLSQASHLGGYNIRFVIVYMNHIDTATLLGVSTNSSNTYNTFTDAQGDIIVRGSRNPDSFSVYNNIYDYMDSVKILEGFTRKAIADNIANGKSGYFRYTRDGVQFISLYTSIGYSDWYSWTSVKATDVEAKYNQLIVLSLASTIVLALLFALGLSASIIANINNKRKIAQLINVDEITGGLSLSRFKKRAANTIAGSSSKYSVVCINIRQFNLVNDNFGRSRGDDLLKDIYKVLTANLEGEEICARKYADRFVVLITHYGAEEVEVHIKDWDIRVEQYSSMREYPFSVRLTYGVYGIKNSQHSIDTIIDMADFALSNIDGVDRNVIYYDDNLRNKLSIMTQLKEDLDKAFADEQFKVYLQGLHNAITHEVCGYEALVRWQHPTEGLIMPNDFISLLESSGQITKLTKYMLEQCCKLIKLQKDKKLSTDSISINVSRVDIMQLHIANELAEICDKYGVNTRQFVLELTENMMVNDSNKLIEFACKARQKGFRVAMDDFGSGYSSLSMLNDINMDFVKIDRQFFSHGTLTDRSKKIIAGVVSLARQIDIEVVAEGVETHEQATFLKECGCDELQGYCFSRPEPALMVLSKQHNRKLKF